MKGRFRKGKKAAQRSFTPHQHVLHMRYDMWMNRRANEAIKSIQAHVIVASSRMQIARICSAPNIPAPIKAAKMAIIAVETAHALKKVYAQ